MSDELGPITFGKTEELMFLGKELGTERNYSESTAQKIDTEVHAFIERAHKAAQKILSTNKKALAAIAEELMKKETLEQEEYNALLRGFKLKQVVV